MLNPKHHLRSHKSRRTNLTINKKFTQEPPKQILNTGLTTTQNHSTLKTMKTTQNYLKEYWTIKRKHFTPKVTLRIIRRCTAFNTTKRKCYLCLNEKLEIASYKGDNLMNKKSELISKCRHTKTNSPFYGMTARTKRYVFH